MTSTAAPTVVVVDGGYELAEGGRWVDGRYVYVDILSGRLRVARRRRAYRAPTGRPRGAVGCRRARGRPAGYLDRRRGHRHRAAHPRRRAGVAGPPRGPHSSPQPDERRSRGPRRTLLGLSSMAYDGTHGAGSLYRTDPDGTVARVLDGLTIANGPAFTADGTTLYLADTAAGTILRCRIDLVSGDLSGGPEAFARLSEAEGSPDGMTVDDEGCLWVAMWGETGTVRRYRPDGRLLQTLTVPAPHPTSVCLHPGGNRLFVTTARYGVTRPTPASGAVLSVPVPARATAACFWRGRS